MYFDVFYTITTSSGRKHVVYKNYVYRLKRHVPETKISFWSCYKIRCQAKIMLKLAEKQVVGEMKKHDHGPPTRVFEKGVWKNIGKNIIKGGSQNKNLSAKNKNLAKAIEKITQSKVTLKRVRTVEVQTTEVRMGGSQTVEVQTFKIQTIEVQTMTPTMKVNSVNIQTVHVQTIESGVQTVEAQNPVIQPELVSIGMGFNMFTEVPPLVSTKHRPAVEVLQDNPTEMIAHMEIPAGLAGTSHSTQGDQPIIYYQSSNGIQISELAQPTEVLPAETTRFGETGQLNMEGYRKEAAQYVPASQTTKITKCPKHLNAPIRVLCKKEGCNKIHIAKNVAVPSLNAIKPQSVTQHMPVHHFKPVTQTKTDIYPSSANEPVLTYYKTAPQPKPVNAAQTKYVNLVCVQTDKGPQILALPQPAPSPKSNQFSPSANATQTPYQGSQQSPMLIDLSSSLVQPPVVNQPDSNMNSFLSMGNQPSTSVVIVAKPTISTNERQSCSKIAQVIQPTVDSTSNVHQPSSNVMNPSLLTQLSSSMVSQFFTSLEDIPLSTPNVEQLSALSASEIQQPASEEVVQQFSSEIGHPSILDLNQTSASEIEINPPFPSDVDQPSISSVDQSSILEVAVDQSFTIGVDQSADLEVNQPSNLKDDQTVAAVNDQSYLEVEQSSVAIIEQPTTSTVQPSTISPVDQPIEQPTCSEVEVVPISDSEGPSGIKPKPPKAKYPFTSKVDEPSSEEDYLPPEPAVKKPKVAKRISKPRKSKYRAELLLKTYISDFSDDD